MIPGCTYVTKEGIEVLYFGFGDFYCGDENGNPHSPTCSNIKDKYVYLRMKDLVRFIKKGEMTEDLSYFCGKGGIVTRLSLRSVPRPLKSDEPVRKLFDESYFNHLMIEDVTYNDDFRLWHFKRH